MSNAMIIMRRELRALYTSPIGYIYMIVFLAVSVGLYMTTFFAFPMADMRNYFGNLPLVLCVFIPAVTMRIWAEERKENTWEMLLTFPMRPVELVMGKFLAVFAFFALTLAGTLTVPVMLAVLGNPDNGAILSGYIGTLLLGALFLSIGIFFSGFFKDQIVAFVVTLLACFALFLLGTNLIASVINDFFGEESVFAGLGWLLGRLLGVTEHYNAFTRGVVKFGDVLFFLVWTGAFLYLNVLYVGERHRPKARQTYAASIALCAAIGLAFNWLVSDMNLGRIDFTENKVYTISPATKSILSRLDDTVQVKLYISERSEMPTQLQSLEQDIVDKLEDLQAASGGRIAYSAVYPNATSLIEAMQAKQSDDPFGMGFMGEEEEPEEEDSTKTEEEKIVEERLLEKGIEPLSVQAMSDDAVTSKFIYSTIGIGYKDKPEELLPGILPQSLPELEYRLVSTIYKLTREKAPVVALVAPKEAVNIPEQQRQLMMQLGQPIPESQDPYSYLEQILRQEKYDVRRVELTQASPLPEEYDAIAVVNPRDLNERQLWEINRAVVSGKPLFLAVQGFDWRYSVQQARLKMDAAPQNPGVGPLLSAWGLGVSNDILMDANNIPLSISSGNALQDMLGGGQTVPSATHMLISSDSLDSETSITGRLSTIFYLWGAPLTLDEEKLKTHGLEYKVIARTSDKAWTAPMDGLSSSVLLEPGSSEQEAYPIMVMASGQFPDAYKEAPRPGWPAPQPQPGQPPMPPMEDDSPVTPLAPAPGKVILIGGGTMFRDDFVQGRAFQANLELFLNSVDALALSDDIVHVRGQKPIDRMIERPTDGQRAFWKFVNYALINASIAGVGVAVALMRVRGRNAYTVAHMRGR